MKKRSKDIDSRDKDLMREATAIKSKTENDS